MAEKDLHTWFQEVREDLTTYLQARAKLTKLEAYEKVAKVMGVLISFFILALLVGILIVFILITLGGWIAKITGSDAIGFTSIVLLVTALLIFLSVKRKTVLEKPVSKWVIAALFDEEEFFSGGKLKKRNDNEE